MCVPCTETRVCSVCVGDVIADVTTIAKRYQAERERSRSTLFDARHVLTSRNCAQSCDT